VSPAHLPATLRVLSLLVLLPGCLRDHPQEDGVYALRATDVERDGCGLVGPDGDLGEIELARHGNDMHGWLSIHGIALQGRYLQAVEAFRIAGDAASVSTELEGRACTVPLVQATLEAETTLTGERANAAFTGTLHLAYRSPLDAACACELRAGVEGTLLPITP